MKKRIFSLMICISILLSLFVFAPQIVSAAESSACGNGLLWRLSADGTLTISGTGDMWSKKGLSVNPPWETEGISVTEIIVEEGVTSIGESMFIDCRELTRVSLPNTLTRIEDRAFKLCTSLTDISIPQGVTYIGVEAFYCTAIKEVAIPSGLETIEDSAFSSTKLERVVIPEGVEKIDYNAFSVCDNLVEVIFPSTLKTIGQKAFEGCTGLTEITIPEGVTTISREAFTGCRNLNSISLPDGIINFAYEEPGNLNYYNGEHPFTNTGYSNNENNWENGILYIGSYLIDVKTDLEGEVYIKEGTKYITDKSFYRCNKITKVVLSESAERIYCRAFYNCSSLEEFVLNDNLNYIGNDAFLDSAFYKNEANWENELLYAGRHLVKAKNNITGAILRDNTLGIANYAFANCKNLTSVSVPDSVKYIGDYAFYYCDKLSGFKAPSFVKYIGDYAFCYCKYIAEQITIPDTTAYLGIYAFSNCTSLKNISIGAGLAQINDGAFTRCGLTSLIIPDNINKIGAGAFQGCNHLEGIRMGAGVKLIEDYAFCGISPLEEIIISDSVEYIGEYSFSQTSAKSITIGAGLREVGILGAFMYNNDLEEFIVSDANPVYSSEDGVLFNKNKTLLIQYPVGKSDEEYTVPDGVITIGVGAIFNTEDLRVLNISNTVRYIAQEAVANAYGLESVTLGNSVEIIGTKAFSNDSYLMEIEFPDSVRRIEYGAFESNVGLERVEFGENLSYIGDNAFSGCPIGCLRFPESLESIGLKAFYNCRYIDTVIIPGKVSAIGEEAFGNCTSLEIIVVSPENQHFCSVDNNLYTRGMETLLQYAIGKRDSYFCVPVGVKNIGDYAFEGCNWIETVNISDGVEYVGREAFSYCANLNTLYIPESVTELFYASSGESIVDRSEDFGTIYYSGTHDQWDNIDMYDNLEGNRNITLYCDCEYFTENAIITYNSGNTVAKITPSDEMFEKRLIFALYKDGMFQGMETVVCDGDTVDFYFDVPHDEIKIMYWEGEFSSVAPFVKAEEISTDSWN